MPVRVYKYEITVNSIKTLNALCRWAYGNNDYFEFLWHSDEDKLLIALKANAAHKHFIQRTQLRINYLRNMITRIKNRNTIKFLS